jgi:SAM-dependent methyltransferase
MVMLERDGLRQRLHGMWSAVAASWSDYAEYADTRGAAVTSRMLELSAPRPGERVLELACGPGGVGLAAAPLVGPGGEVVLSDVVAEMTAIAAARARGLDNVRTRELDLERIDEPDASYDVVLCREGLMFALDPGAAVREIRRVLRPGGRVALAVWGPRERNPWLSLIFDTVGAHLGEPVPPPGIPGPFALDDANRLADLLTGAGLASVDVEEIAVPVRDASFDDWWARTTALAGPLAGRLAALPSSVRAAIEADLREAVRPFSTPRGLEFPGVTLLAGARNE